MRKGLELAHTGGEFSRTRYGRIAWFYDLLDLLHFGGMCRRTSACLLDRVPPGTDTALVAACGTGQFAVDLADALRPRELAINDLSKDMLRISTERLGGSEWNGQLHAIEGDITTLDGPPQYDLIALNYTLNMFAPSRRAAFLAPILARLSPGGLFMVADFSRPRSWLLRAVSTALWGLAVAFFWVVSGDRPNMLGDMDQSLKATGMELVVCRRFMGGLYSAYLLRKPTGVGSQGVCSPSHERLGGTA